MKMTVEKGALGHMRSKPRISNDLLRRANKIWNDAIKVGLTAVIDSDVIEVDTGMAKSSLVPLARAVRMKGIFKSSIRPQRTRKGYTELDGSWNPEGEKSAATGEALGEDAFVIVPGKRGVMNWQLEFNIPVWHYVAHELGLVPGTGPWLSLEIFRDAMLNHLKLALEARAFLPDNITELFFFAGRAG